jgi:hypothetical protein
VRFSKFRSRPNGSEPHHFAKPPERYRQPADTAAQFSSEESGQFLELRVTDKAERSDSEKDK